MSPRDFLIRGLLAGVIAGIAAFAVAYVVGEPSVNASIAIEQAGGGHSHGSDAHGSEVGGTEAGETGAGAEAGHSHDSEQAPTAGEVEVPRSLQSTVGMLTGMLVAGVTLGGLVGVVSAIAMGRFGGLRPRATTLAVAAVGFVAVYVVPFSVYPPNPPAVGSGDTIALRSALYFSLLAISLIAAVTAVLVGRRLSERLGPWAAGVTVVVAYAVVMVLVAALLPSYNEVPETFPATVLYDFRTASFLTQLTLWSVLGTVLASFVGRLTGANGQVGERALADTRG